jgi:hypothetical protein
MVHLRTSIRSDCPQRLPGFCTAWGSADSLTASCSTRYSSGHHMVSGLGDFPVSTVAGLAPSHLAGLISISSSSIPNVRKFMLGALAGIEFLLVDPLCFLQQAVA